jgi:hypothetical protein
MVRDAGLVTELETHAPMTREELEAVDMHCKATGRITASRSGTRRSGASPSVSTGKTAVGGALAAKLSEYDHWRTPPDTLFRS